MWCVKVLPALTLVWNEKTSLDTSHLPQSRWLGVKISFETMPGKLLKTKRDTLRFFNPIPFNFASPDFVFYFEGCDLSMWGKVLLTLPMFDGSFSLTQTNFCGNLPGSVVHWPLVRWILTVRVLKPLQEVQICFCLCSWRRFCKVVGKCRFKKVCVVIARSEVVSAIFFSQCQHIRHLICGGLRHLDL